MVLMEWTDHSRRRFESWRISIFYRKWLQNTANQWLPCFWLSSFDRYSRHNSHYVACFSPIVTPFDSCIFFREARPATKRESPEGRGEQGHRTRAAQLRGHPKLWRSTRRIVALRSSWDCPGTAGFKRNNGDP